jgi:hypothetical protein
MRASVALGSGVARKDNRGSFTALAWGRDRMGPASQGKYQPSNSCPGTGWEKMHHSPSLAVARGPWGECASVSTNIYAHGARALKRD